MKETYFLITAKDGNEYFITKEVQEDIVNNWEKYRESNKKIKAIYYEYFGPMEDDEDDDSDVRFILIGIRDIVTIEIEEDSLYN